MNIGTKIGAKIAHLAEPEDTKILTNAKRIMKDTQSGIPVKPMFSKKSAPAIASRVPSFVQLNKPWNCPQKKQNRT